LKEKLQLKKEIQFSSVHCTSLSPDVASRRGNIAMKNHLAQTNFDQWEGFNHHTDFSAVFQSINVNVHALTNKLFIRCSHCRVTIEPRTNRQLDASHAKTQKYLFQFRPHGIGGILTTTMQQ